MLTVNPSTTFEAVPRYFRMPRDVHREHLRVIARRCWRLASG